MASTDFATTTGRYTRTAVALHWLMAILIVSNVALGWTMSDMSLTPTRIRLFSYHKWIGITILALAALRLAWRLFHRPPPLPAHLPGWQQAAAHGVHWLLYALFFLVTLAGWTYTSAAGFPVVYLGVLPLPDLVPVDKGLAGILKQVHAFLAYGLAAIVVVHVAAALKHGFERPRGYLRRMTRIRST